MDAAVCDRPCVGAGGFGCGRRMRGKNHSGQATKGVWGMSWRQEAMKGVEGCEKPGEAVKRALIPGSLNDRALNP
jgi:hypothetical protein